MTVPTKEALKSIGINGSALEKLTTICNKILELQNEFIAAQNKADRLIQLPRCCGSEYIDPKGFMYANHGIDDICPMHGQHPKHPGKKRLKKYIGNKTEAMHEVYEAMENWRTWHKAEREVGAAKNNLEQLIESLDRPVRVASGRPWYSY